MSYQLKPGQSVTMTDGSGREVIVERSQDGKTINTYTKTTSGLTLIQQLRC